MDLKILGFLKDTALEALEVNSSLENWAASIGEVLYYPQQEIIQTICDPKNRNITLLASRSAGKSYGVCLAIIKLCLDNPGYEVLVFAPKSTQSERLLGVIRKIAKKPGNKTVLNKEINWLATNVSKITFKNGSLITALSGDESTQVEGYHGDLIVMDECHQISDSVFNLRISPMIKSSANPKILKLGISLYKNNFYQSCHDDQWVHLVYPWNVCKNVFKAGVTTVDGVDYPNSVLDDMPLSYKLARFPDNPELHFPSKSKLSEEAFDTQYEMKWTDTLTKFLTDKELVGMIGNHDYLYSGVDGEEYYFGIDFAGGALIKTGESDYTQLVVIRKYPDGTKEVVHVAEWQGDVVDQLDEISNIISPVYGLFKCKFGTADYSTLGIGMVDILVKNYKLPIAGIQLKRTEPVSGRQYKIALFDNWQAEAQQGYFYYPKQECIEHNELLKKHFYEWESLEKRYTKNQNIQISAPLYSNIHDDCPIATIMACWAADRMQEELRRISGVNRNKMMHRPILFKGSSDLSRHGGARTSFFDRFAKIKP